MGKRVGNKGQITLFVIIGVVALIIVALVLSIRSCSKIKPASGPGGVITISDDHVGAMRNYVDACIESVSKEAIYHVGLRGGYISAEPKPLYGETGVGYYRKFNGVNVSVLVDKNNKYYLSIDEIGKRLERKICIDLKDCLDFSYFEELGIQVVIPDWDNFNIIDRNCNASIKDKSVFLRIHYPVQLRAGDEEVTVSLYSADIQIGLGRAYKSAVLMISRIQSTGLPSTPPDPPNYYNISNHCPDYDINGLTNIYLKGGNKIIQIVDFEPSRLDKNIMATPFIFQFAVNNYDVQGGCTG